MAKYSLRRSPGPLIRRVHQIGVSIFADEFNDKDITPLQFSILWVLTTHSGEDQASLAQYVALDRTTCSNIVSRLEERGYLRREVDPENKRAKLVYITDAGRKLFREVEVLMEKVSKRLLKPLLPEERKIFLNLLQKLAESNNELSRAPMRYLPLK
ncbi:MAG: MarR family transcriptional regulator [Pseudomonadales bacterium]|nr:MarR family transcriptional regulator [Pseudomonadales bacterium]